MWAVTGTPFEVGPEGILEFFRITYGRKSQQMIDLQDQADIYYALKQVAVETDEERDDKLRKARRSNKAPTMLERVRINPPRYHRLMVETVRSLCKEVMIGRNGETGS